MFSSLLAGGEKSPSVPRLLSLSTGKLTTGQLAFLKGTCVRESSRQKPLPFRSCHIQSGVPLLRHIVFCGSKSPGAAHARGRDHTRAGAPAGITGGCLRGCLPHSTSNGTKKTEATAQELSPLRLVHLHHPITPSSCSNREAALPPAVWFPFGPIFSGCFQN